MSGCPIVSCEWLYDQLQDDRKKSKIQILDVSTSGSSGSGIKAAKLDFNEAHIEGANFYDITLCRDKTSSISNMLPSVGVFNDYVRYFGVSADVHVVVYDNSDTGFDSTPRVWYCFRALNHRRVSILAGGLKLWTAKELPLTSNKTPDQKKEFNAGQWRRLDSIYSTISEVKRWLDRKSSTNQENEEAITDTVYIDVRPKDQYNGTSTVGVKGCLPGHLPDSINVANAWKYLVDEHNQLRSVNEIKMLFAEDGLLEIIEKCNKVIVACNNGMESAVLFLALTLIGTYKMSLYDGGWEEISKSIPDRIVKTEEVI